MGILSSLMKGRPRIYPQAAIEIHNAFQAFSGTAYSNATFRAAVDAVSRHAGKLTAHSGDKGLETLLSAAPNPYMGGYDLLYKTATAYCSRTTTARASRSREAPKR